MKKLLSILLIAILVPAILVGSVVLAVNTNTANSGITIGEEPTYNFNGASYGMPGDPIYVLEGDCPFFETELGKGMFKNAMNYYSPNLYSVTFKKPTAGTYHIQAFQHSAWWIANSEYTAAFGEREDSTVPFELTIPKNCKSITFSLHLTGENKGYVTVGATMDNPDVQEFTVTYKGCCEDMEKTVMYGDHFKQVIMPYEDCDIVNAVAVMGKDTCIWPERKEDGSVEFDIPYVTGNIVIGVYMYNWENPVVGCQAIQSITHNMEHVTFYDTSAYGDFFDPMTSLLPVFRLSVYPHLIAVMPDEGYEITSLRAINRYYDRTNGGLKEVEEEVKKDENGCYLFNGFFDDNMHLEGVVEPIGTGRTTASTDQTTASTTASTPANTPASTELATHPIPIKVDSIALSDENVILNVGKTKTLKATATPSYAANKGIKWSSNDTKVAKVDKNGKVTALKKGTATITATALDGSGIKAVCKITVKQPVNSIRLNVKSKTLKVGQRLKIKATAKPDTANDKYIKWTVNSKNVKLSYGKTKSGKNNVVTAKKAGKAKITAKPNDGSRVSASCTITVKKKQ